MSLQFRREVPMDAESVKRLLQTLGNRVEANGLDSLGEEERTAHVPFWAVGIIGQGGFLYYLSGTTHPLSDVARRLRLLGYEAAAGACERVVAALFPDGVERPEEYRALAQTIDWARFRAEKKILFAIGYDDMLRVIGRFVEANRLCFRDLAPPQ